jgi:DNA mismatch repair protein MutL
MFEQEAPNSRLFDNPNGDQKTTLRFESAVNKQEIPNADPTEKGLFQFQQRYLVRATRNGIMFIDQQAAHERILFDKFLAQLKGAPGNSQQSLFPQALTLSAPDFALALEMEREIYALGFRFEVFGKNTFLISGMPADVSGSEKELFEGLIEQFKKNQSELNVPIRENLAQALARRAALKAGQKLSTEEMEALATRLFSCPNPNFSPDGRPTFFIFDSSKIESYFTR